ncbi:hypothetical protein WG915_09085 [Corynebacterium sp. H128]|uniref:hypothetical protein n=1 Tax=unclassified Corynebacterium TaxID=2624378 RepID=UPI0030AD6DBF
MSLLRRVLLTLMLLAPLIGGAIYSATVSLEPASSWSEEPAAAPGAVDLVPARRAAGEASSQAGFLKQGTTGLVDGTGKLADGTNQLAGGSTDAVAGANELANGMTQIQAGTGQLGDGAVKVADGVSLAVDQVQGIGLVQGRIVEEINRVDADLAKKKDPESVAFRAQLAEFKTQVEAFKLDAAVVDQLAQLRSGSREIANQLAVPGYGYHDGIYSATKGSKELATGLTELDKGLAEAATGAGELKDGAVKVDGMATSNKDKIGAVQRALPADPATPTQPQPMLVPLFGFFVAALVMVGAALSSRWRALAAVALGAMIILIMAADLSPLVGLGLVGVVALAGLVSALVSRALVGLFGERVGRIAVYVGLLLQAGVVGWVWKLASTDSVSPVLNVLTHLMPMHYATSAMSALGNGGSNIVLGLSCGVLAALVVLAAVTLRLAGTAPALEPVDIEADHDA